MGSAKQIGDIPPPSRDQAAADHRRHADRDRGVLAADPCSTLTYRGMPMVAASPTEAATARQRSLPVHLLIEGHSQMGALSPGRASRADGDGARGHTLIGGLRIAKRNPPASVN